MKNIIAIETHSFVDVITNSSTEIFICDTEKSLKTVEEILTVIVRAYEIGKDPDGELGLDISYEEFFRKPFIYTEEKYKKDAKDDNCWGYQSSHNVGKILIMGSEDNSIPYELWDSIDDIFNARHEHLG